jgi:hypothetical protein
VNSDNKIRGFWNIVERIIGKIPCTVESQFKVSQYKTFFHIFGSFYFLWKHVLMFLNVLSFEPGDASKM